MRGGYYITDTGELVDDSYKTEMMKKDPLTGKPINPNQKDRLTYGDSKFYINLVDDNGNISESVIWYRNRLNSDPRILKKRLDSNTKTYDGFDQLVPAHFYRFLNDFNPQTPSSSTPKSSSAPSTSKRRCLKAPPSPQIFRIRDNIWSVNDQEMEDELAN